MRQRNERREPSKIEMRVGQVGGGRNFPCESR